MSKQAESVTENLLARIQANLFPAAHPAVEPWKTFKWHTGKYGCDTWQLNSSQALAIDFFGTLKMVDQVSRDMVLDEIALDIGIESGGPWRIELEWEDKDNLLNEPRPTQIDAIAISPRAMIYFEAKFGEMDGGCCSQTAKSKTGIAQCNGSYRMQQNPRNQKLDHCALSGKGIRYWQVIPEVMFFDKTVEYSPCPFNGPWYQWMRNIVLAHEKSKAERKAAAIVIVYANHSSLHFPKVVQSQNWQLFASKLREDSVIFQTRTYQDLLNMSVGARVPAAQTLLKLRSWIFKKIETVAERR